MVRSPAFHAGNRGSNPLRITTHVYTTLQNNKIDLITEPEFVDVSKTKLL